MTRKDTACHPGHSGSQIELGLCEDRFSGLSSADCECAVDIPDGRYQVRIEQVRLTRTARTGKPMLVWLLRIVGPHRRGERLTKKRVITPKTLDFVKQDLERCGVQLKRFADLELHLHEMDGQAVTVTSKRNDAGWLDVTFARPGLRPSPPPSSAPLPERDDDDLPF